MCVDLFRLRQVALFEASEQLNVLTCIKRQKSHWINKCQGRYIITAVMVHRLQEFYDRPSPHQNQMVTHQRYSPHESYGQHYKKNQIHNLETNV